MIIRRPGGGSLRSPGPPSPSSGPPSSPLRRPVREVTETTIRASPPRLARDKVLMLLSDGYYHSVHEISKLPGLEAGAWYTALFELIEHNYVFARRANSLLLLAERRTGSTPLQDLAELLAGIDASKPEPGAQRMRPAEQSSDDRVVVKAYEDDANVMLPSEPEVDRSVAMKLSEIDVQLSAKDYIVSTRAILARKSSGKTYLAMVIAEEILRISNTTGTPMPFVAFDPTGVWYGLCADVDGLPSSHKILRLGGRHGDFPLRYEEGGAVARMVVGCWPLSVILDVSDMLPEEQHQFFGDFGNQLYTLSTKPLHLFLDEADDFCLSDDTEILTSDGWKGRRDVRKGTVAVGFDLEREACVYEPVLRKIEREHNGPMVSLKTRSLDCLVTKDHRVVLRRQQRAAGRKVKKYPWTFCGADKVPDQVEVPGPRPIVGRNEDLVGISDDMIRVIGWVLTDGFVHVRSEGDTICLAQAYKTIKRGVRTAKEMISVLRKLGVRTKRNERVRITEAGTRSRLFEWYLGTGFSEEIYKWLPRPLPLKIDRRIPRSLLVSLSVRQLGVLFDALMQGDGSTWKGRWKTFTPGLGELFVDDFQELASIVGISTTKTHVVIAGKVQWCACVRSVRTTHYVRKPRVVERYSGVVWDVTVPSGAFVARRNGRVFITGNCPQSVESGNKAQRRALGVGDRIVRRARVKGIGVTLITQRPAVISKNVLSQVDGVFFLQVSAPHDLEAVDSWMKPAVTSSDRQLALGALPSLERGEAFFVQAHKKAGALIQFKTRAKQTFDSSRTPTVDDPDPPVPSLSRIDQDIWEKVSQMLGHSHATPTSEDDGEREVEPDDEWP